MAKNICTERLEDVELMTQLNAQRARNRELTEKIEAMGKVGIALTTQLEQERAKRKKEISGLTAFVGVGAALCAFLWHRTGSTTAAIIAGSASVIVLRLLAAHFRWSLPH